MGLIHFVNIIRVSIGIVEPPIHFYVCEKSNIWSSFNSIYENEFYLGNNWIFFT